MFFTWCKCCRFYERVVYLPECTCTHICVIVKTQHKWSDPRELPRGILGRWWGIPGTGRSHSLLQLQSACTTRCHHWCPAGWRRLWGRLLFHQVKAARSLPGRPPAWAPAAPLPLGKARSNLGEYWARGAFAPAEEQPSPPSQSFFPCSVQWQKYQPSSQKPQAGIETSRWHWEILLINSIKRVDNSADW